MLSVAYIPFANIKGEGFMSSTAASQQGAVRMCLNFSGALMLAIRGKPAPCFDKWEEPRSPYIATSRLLKASRSDADHGVHKSGGHVVASFHPCVW